MPTKKGKEFTVYGLGDHIGSLDEMIWNKKKYLEVS